MASDISPENRIRNKLAKRLNQRMRTLEKAGIDYGAIREYKDYLEKYYPGRKRLPEKGKQRPSNVSYRSQIYKFQSIMDMPTGSLSGINAINRKRMRTFKERYGIEFKDTEELKAFVESEYFADLTKIYKSKQAVRIIAESKYDLEEIQGRYQTFRAKTGRDIISSSNLLRVLGFRNKSSVLKAIAENIMKG